MKYGEKMKKQLILLVFVTSLLPLALKGVCVHGEGNGNPTTHRVAVIQGDLRVVPIPNINWTPANSKTTYIFAPGILESERYAASYCPTYYASTGEIFFRPSSMNILENPTSCNFPEVSLRKKSDNSSIKELSIISQILTLIQNTRRSKLDMELGVTTNYAQDARYTVQKFDLDITKVYFGQEYDIQTLSKTYAEHIKKYPTGDVVLHGFSRGAATVLNFLATSYKGLPTKDQRVRACILEACYDKLPASPSMVPQWLFEWIFPGYKPQGIWPKDVVENFPKNIPVLLVTSKKDVRVPATCSWQLYDALRNADHTYVHILELENSAHPGYTYENAADREKYETTVHAFYKKYGLPHDPELAEKGKVTFGQTRL
jgi:dienelactone hydrolase